MHLTGPFDYELPVYKSLNFNLIQRAVTSPAPIHTSSNSSSFFTQALGSLNKKDMTEIKSYGCPPALVETVMQAVMILLGKEPTWAEAKRQLGERKQQYRIHVRVCERI